MFSNEVVDLIKQSDVVVTNPPFSLFGKFIKLLSELNVDFIVVGNMNMFPSVNVRPLVLNHKVHCGFRTKLTWDFETCYENYSVNKDKSSLINIGGIIWFQTLTIPNKPIYNPKVIKPIESYQRLTNYNAVNIPNSKEIPVDSDQILAVPISFISKLNENQFQIIDAVQNPKIGERLLFNRLLIKLKK